MMTGGEAICDHSSYLSQRRKTGDVVTYFDDKMNKMNGKFCAAKQTSAIGRFPLSLIGVQLENFSRA
jgi:hypothetical protein